jgi:hypothetical protein
VERNTSWISGGIDSVVKMTEKDRERDEYNRGGTVDHYRPRRQNFTRLQPEKIEQSQRRSRAITGYILLQD